MSKLYVFGIGGTGSRVIKSLVMLLGSGVPCAVDTIVPVIIDPDDSAADLTRTVNAMKKYINIRQKLDFSNSSKNNFFRTEILESVSNFKLPLDNTRNVKFKDFMAVDTMSSENRAFVNMLFSQKNLDSNMRVGFKGNPNIGSVVLNQFEDSVAFRDFGNSFQQGDKIFIISSIFGGTGASGFPLLVKNLRNSSTLPNYALINSAQIGAISVLPYFGIKLDDNSEIDSGTFISKTKAALSYYYTNISENKTVDTLYYIADDIKNQYDNCEGGRGQKNNAHFIELVSAMAILDFARGTSNDGITIKEYGLDKDSQEVIFGDLGSDSSSVIQKPLAQFQFFSNYLKHHNYYSQTWVKDIKLDSNLKQYIDLLRTFQDDYVTWLSEMDDNKRKFTPFDLKPSNKGSFAIIKGKTPNKLWSLKSNFDLFDGYVNKQRLITSVSKEQQFTEIFYNATSDLMYKLFNL